MIVPPASSMLRPRALCLMGCVMMSVHGGRMDILPAHTRRQPPVAMLGLGRRAFASRLATAGFDDADSNRDGSVDRRELYVMVLKLYVQINRRAPARPPTRQQVDAHFAAADTDRNGRLSKDEFIKFSTGMCRRAAIRVVAHKVITVFGAPYLATTLVKQLRGSNSLLLFGERIVPTRFHAMVLTETFCLTGLTVVFVASLGNAAFEALDAFFALQQYPHEAHLRSIR